MCLEASAEQLPLKEIQLEIGNVGIGKLKTINLVRHLEIWKLEIWKLEMLELEI